MEQRTILFRGKTIDFPKWIYGFYVTDGNEHGIIPLESFTRSDNGEAMDFFYTRVDPETVGQFTGKEDKNGKKIFEGHRVKVHGHEYNVIFNERMTSFDIATTGNGIGFYNSKDIEITGTIHK